MSNQKPLMVNARAGGQVFRTSLGLSALLQKPVQIEQIRQNRPNPGLRAQHLTTLQTIQQLSNARVKGAFLGSQKVLFAPQQPVSSQLLVNIGTAGSTGLLLQSLFFPSLITKNRLRLVGGTNVPFAPPLEFVLHCLLPALRALGCRFKVTLNNHGFYPKGKGAVSFSSKHAKLPLKPVYFADLGELQTIEAFSACASLPREVAERQSQSAQRALAFLQANWLSHLDWKEKSASKGSSLVLLARFSTGRILSATALGKKGLPAEEVGKQAARSLLKQIKAGGAVDEHLADQLIPFIALAKGKSMLACTNITAHALENIKVCEQFLKVKFEVSNQKNQAGKILVEGAGFKA